MKAHKGFDLKPSNSRGNVLKYVLAQFEPNSPNEEVPELLSKFITLLGNEKEDWEGVRAIKVCMDEYFIWKEGIPELKEKKKPFVGDLEKFMFSSDRNVIVILGADPSSTSKEVIPGAVDPPSKLEALKGPGRPSSSKAFFAGAVVPSANPETKKGPDSPSTTKAVGKGAVGETSVLPAYPNTLKFKIYMGTGWDIDFPNLNRGSPPNLFVNVTIHGGESHMTKVQKKTKTPCWGEEFPFPLSNAEGAKLSVEVNDKIKDNFAGKFCQLVSALKPGIQVIPLSSKVGIPCRSARLLVRIIFN